MRSIVLLFIVLLFGGFSGNAQTRHKPGLEKFIRERASPFLKGILDNPDTYRYQLIYTRIDRNRANQPRFRSQYLRVDADEYFNPASMVKLPVAILALEKLNQLKKYGVNRNSTMLTDSSCCRQTPVLADTSAADGKPSIAHYIKKIFIVSDNDAYNRLYEFVGQETINRRLQEMGYRQSRITRRFVSMNEEENRHTNPIRFLDAEGKLLFHQPAAYNPQPFDFSKKILIGNAHYDRNDSLIHRPMDFTTHNNMPLDHLRLMLQSVLFPNSVAAEKRFRIDEDDREFLRTCMQQLPSESISPVYDTTEFFNSYTKFFFFRDGKQPIPPSIRSYNKTGWSYGFLTDVAYIVDKEKGVEFILSGVIYVNSDGVLNDDKYEYEGVGYRYFREIGEMVYQYESGRKRKNRDFRIFALN